MQKYIRDAGPHCRQAGTALARPHFADAELRPLAELPTYLCADSPQMSYAERPDNERSGLHWGQMKLFLSELRFLMDCRRPDMTIIYAGAAPGHHVPYLASLFPSFSFRLYDPSPFCDLLSKVMDSLDSLDSNPLKKIQVHGRFFDDALALELQTELGALNTAFVCDIRTGKSEECVQADMAMQAGWVRRLRPARALLKFRLPWQPGVTPYLAGDILLPVYAPLTSTEARLVVEQGLDGPATKDYVNEEYERQCAHHNVVGRARAYAHDVAASGLDHCHDCATLVALAEEYLRATRQPAAGRDVVQFIENTQAAFGLKRTLATQYSASSTRAKKQFAPLAERAAI